MGSLFLAAIMWIVIVFFDRELLMFFGAQGQLLSLAETYLIPIKFVIQVFYLFRC